MSLTTRNTDEFAFGANEYDFCQCPAVTAGMDPAGTGDNHVPGLLEAAEQFDSLVQEDESGYKGVIEASQARESWMEMVELAEDNNHHQTLKAAVQVAVELGWAEAGDYDL